VFASSVAVYGGDMPPVITDATSLNPQTSYGSQKAMGEMMVNDWSRKGFVDGCSLRLPTVVVRPGKPNKAASTWASSIIREPLQGHQAVCPVDDSVSMWVGSPRAVVKSFLHAHDLPAAAFGPNRSVLLPGMTVSVRTMMDTLKKVGGPEVAARVAFQKDERIARIVAGWAYRVEPKRAAELGFAADESYETIVRSFVEDDIERSRAA
ncbi:MAG: NAD-dependent epimerase/dehydratase family protein, partial [Alphaproteobacteria bacterium]|nr:NAD-dependent epimerase/dehydratase family protein [Alphaproteobacteria bacterium]